MLQKIDYNPQTLALLNGIRVTISRYVSNDTIVLWGADRPIKPVGVARDISMWNLKTGEVIGSCKMDDCVEMHMSPARFSMIKDAFESKSPIRTL